MQLTVVRHANATDAQGDMQDIQRPLSAAGRQEARIAAARFMTEVGSKPDLLLASPAVRTLETARIFAAELGYDPARIQTDARLYPGSRDKIDAVVEDIDPAVQHAVIFGHNPGISEFAALLSGDSSREFLPTSGFVTAML